MNETLGTALPREIARVRDEVLPLYVEIGASGVFAATMMRADLDEASRVMIEGDTVGIIRVYEKLKSWNS